MKRGRERELGKFDGLLAIGGNWFFFQMATAIFVKKIENDFQLKAIFYLLHIYVFVCFGFFTKNQFWHLRWAELYQIKIGAKVCAPN